MAGNADNADHYTGALLEEIRDQLQAVLESQQSLKDVPDDVREIKERLTNVESDLKVVKAAVTDQSRVLADHDQQLRALKHRAA